MNAWLIVEMLSTIELSCLRMTDQTFVVAAWSSGVFSQMEGGPNFFSEDSPLMLDWDESKASRVRKKLLIGKLITEKSLNRNTVKSMIAKGWGISKGLNISEVSQNLFIFSFDKEADCDRVIRDGPWSILGQLLNVKRWSPEIPLSDVNFGFCEFWAQFHGLPLESFSAKNVAKLGRLVGKTIAVEDPVENEKIARSFVRAKVLVDLSKPFVDGFWIPRPNSPRIWLNVKYERLQHLCYQCGRVGHDHKQCGEERAKSLISPSKDRYGPWIGIAPVKAVHRVLVLGVNGDWVVDPLEQDEAREDDAHDEGRKEDSVSSGKDLVCNELPRDPQRIFSNVFPHSSLISVGGPKGASSLTNGPSVFGTSDLVHDASVDVRKTHMGKDRGLLGQFPSLVCGPSVRAESQPAIMVEKLPFAKSCSPSFQADGEEDMSIDSTLLKGPSSSETKACLALDHFLVERPAEVEQVNTCLTLVPVRAKASVEKLSTVLQSVCLKRKALKELSPEKVKRGRSRVSASVLEHQKFSIGYSPPKGRKCKSSPGKRKKKVSKVSRPLLEILVDVPIEEDGGIGGESLCSSMDCSSVTDGLGGWPQTTPQDP
ncbi:TMV resistance protein N-like [Senna tora]|uniref:TMV resistance protein N-like n=1 Tax=Senna tora TaxID=362788 RepID=A0A834WIF8_9FABA|nr:TMV resistance protein N-like [Senna tora]